MRWPWRPSADWSVGSYETTAIQLEAASALILASAAVGPCDAVLVSRDRERRSRNPPPNASAAKVEEYRGELASSYKVRTTGMSLIDTMTLAAGVRATAIGG